MKAEGIRQSRFHVRRSAMMIGALFACAGAFAHAPDGDDPKEPLSRAIAEAHAVIHGTVADVRYRLSEKNEAGERLPHTFVTYKVRGVLAGQVASEALTLRFLGGPDGQGRFLSVSESPMFDVGHEDILLVRGNGTSHCPLVDCGHGRFRIHKERMFNARALPILAVKEGRAINGRTPEAALLRYALPAPSFEGLLEREDVRRRALELSGGNLAALKQRFDAEAPRGIEYATEPGKREGGGDQASGGAAMARIVVREDPPIALAEFARAIAQLPGMRNASHRRVVTSVDPDRPFVAKLPGIGAPAPTPRVLVRPAPESEPDQRERQQVEQNGGDPVIDRRR